MPSGAGLFKYISEKSKGLLRNKETQELLEEQLIAESAALKVLKASAGWKIVQKFIADFKKECKQIAIAEKDVSFLMKEQVLEDLENLINERISESDSLLSQRVSESQ